MHYAILGLTGSGKTFAAQNLAACALSRGRGVLVLHRPDEPWPLTAGPLMWQTDDPDRYLRQYWASRNVDCFMELADADVDKFDAAFHRCFTRGRHGGRRNYYLAQRASQVHPTIRHNCVGLFLFAAGAKDAAVWSDEFNDPALLGASTLPPHEFFFKPDRFTPARRIKIAA